MAFVQNDHMIQQISAAASHRALGNSVLPRTAKCSAHAESAIANSSPQHENYGENPAEA